MNKRLFVGGPAHGEVHYVSDQQTSCSFRNTGFEQFTTYFPKGLILQSGRTEVFISEGTNCKDPAAPWLVVDAALKAWADSEGIKTRARHRIFEDMAIRITDPACRPKRDR